MVANYLEILALHLGKTWTIVCSIDAHELVAIRSPICLIAIIFFGKLEAADEVPVLVLASFWIANQIDSTSTFVSQNGLQS